MSVHRLDMQSLVSADLCTDVPCPPLLREFSSIRGNSGDFCSQAG